jgi:hypothetical protein
MSGSLRIVRRGESFVILRIDGDGNPEFQLTPSDVHSLARLLPAISRQLMIPDTSAAETSAVVALELKSFRLGEDKQSNNILVQLQDSFNMHTTYAIDKKGAKLLTAELEKKLAQTGHQHRRADSPQLFEEFQSGSEESSAWQPIQTAPKDGSEFLCAAFDKKSGRWHFFVERWRQFLAKSGGFVSLRQPSHWWPLPGPPQDDNSG